MAKYKYKPFSSAKKCVYKGMKFPSKLERDIYIELELLERSGVIQNLEVQPRFVLQESFVVMSSERKSGKSTQESIKYTADMRYTRGFDTVVIEVKGRKSTDYNIRKSLFLKRLKEFNVDEFIEVYAKDEIIYRQEIIK